MKGACGVRFTVITGVYNAGLSQLREAVDSVLSQSLRDFEWVICDDGSERAVHSYLKEAARRDKRIRLLANPVNRGLAFSLNRCVEAASTELLLRQDADDRSAPGRFERLVPFMERHPQYALVSSNIILFDEKGPWGKMTYPEHPAKQDFLFCLPFMHGAVGLRREALIRHGGYRAGKRTRRCEDLELFARLYASGEKGYTIQEELYEYREDAAAGRKRKYRYRVDEACVKWSAFRALGLMPRGIPYALKPLAVGLLPPALLNRMKDRYYKRRQNQEE